MIIDQEFVRGQNYSDCAQSTVSIFKYFYVEIWKLVGYIGTRRLGLFSEEWCTERLGLCGFEKVWHDPKFAYHKPKWDSVEICIVWILCELII